MALLEVLLRIRFAEDRIGTGKKSWLFVKFAEILPPVESSTVESVLQEDTLEGDILSTLCLDESPTCDSRTRSSKLSFYLKELVWVISSTVTTVDLHSKL